MNHVYNAFGRQFIIVVCLTALTIYYGSTHHRRKHEGQWSQEYLPDAYPGERSVVDLELGKEARWVG